MVPTVAGGAHSVLAVLDATTMPEWARAVEAARADRRPTLPEPPPVRVEAVRDVRLPCVAGLEVRLDAFYGGLLRMVREPTEFPAYQAENVAVRFEVVEVPPERDGTRPTMVRVQFFNELVERLQADKVEFELVRGLVAGDEGVLLRDPAGNWVAVASWRTFG